MEASPETEIVVLNGKKGKKKRVRRNRLRQKERKSIGKRVSFVLSENETKEFFKRGKVSADKIMSSRKKTPPSKGIIKVHI